MYPVGNVDRPIEDLAGGSALSTPASRSRTLGETVTAMRGEMSLRELNRETGLGLGYLSRLGRDQVKQPSCRALALVARATGGSYGDLLRAAGYL